jgi:hypothetical protein
MKDHAGRVQNAAGYEQPENQTRQYGKDAVIGEHAAPAKNEVKHDRDPIETAGRHELQDNADGCRHPKYGEQHRRVSAFDSINEAIGQRRHVVNTYRYGVR